MASPAHFEAQALLMMARRNGDTLDTVRDLIAVPPEIEKLLRAYVRFHPEGGVYIEMGLRFREQVLEEFERLAKRSGRRRMRLLANTAETHDFATEEMPELRLVASVTCVARRKGDFAIPYAQS